MEPKTSQGLLIVYTGAGKGKTTAALGLALRAWGSRLRVGVLQFVKSDDFETGERAVLRQLGIPVATLGGGFTWQNVDGFDHVQAAQAAWREAQSWVETERFDLLVLDEFTYPLTYGWVDVKDALAWLAAHKPPRMHIVITGRNAPEDLLAAADLVTEMKEVKHPWTTRRLPGQAGIEF